MKSYSYVALVIDGRETNKLDIFKEHNTFSVYEYDENVLTGGYLKVMEFINKWKEKNENIKQLFEASGSTVEFKQTI